MPRVGFRSVTKSIKANRTVVYKTANVEQQQQQGNLISEKMSSSQQFKAGQAYGDSAARTDQLVQSAKDSAQKTAQSALEKKDEMVQTARDTAQRATQSAEENKEHTAGFIQQAGEQMKSMAQNAMETVKSTLGVGESNPKQ
ncbi:hypothetical protein HPP92_007288 [Vanilla planifolia]|uniref:Uncharacterized protein n=1 Tax=Vanilla planifolia TaxID=51239 RepID=A0A835RM37_VANPL|nr:hypothetical protein HPP92_007288 [Vanilla planifolia]